MTRVMTGLIILSGSFYDDMIAHINRLISRVIKLLANFWLVDGQASAKLRIGVTPIL